MEKLRGDITGNMLNKENTSTTMSNLTAHDKTHLFMTQIKELAA